MAYPVPACRGGHTPPPANPPPPPPPSTGDLKVNLSGPDGSYSVNWSGAGAGFAFVTVAGGLTTTVEFTLF